ncbi:MAG: PAS domain-containing protein [Gammaproteobacteria bacterium]|nr:PAS domain-containing protein [Gammaproteobacteria bacterium]
MLKSTVTESNEWLHWRTVWWGAALSTVIFIIFWLLPYSPIGTGLTNYAPLHSLLEIFAVAVAVSIFSVGWHARLAQDTNGLSLLAVGFLIVALYDSAHLISYPGMPHWITDSSAEKAIYFWLAARYTAAFTLLALIVARNSKQTVLVNSQLFLLTGLILAFFCFWLILGNSHWLPAVFNHETGLTSTKILMEWGLVFIGVVSLILIWKHKNDNVLYDSGSLFLALVLSILSELCFTLYSDVADLFNLLGHVYKVLSYGFLYHALVAGGVKRPYKLLAENQQLLQQLTDHIPQVFWMKSEDGKEMLFVSPAYELIWGRTCQSLLSNPESWLEAVHIDDRNRVKESLCSQSGGNYLVEYRINQPDGTLRRIRSQSFPVFDDENRVHRIAGISEDVTERTDINISLETNEARLKAILKTASDGIHILDANGTLIDASDSFLQELGYDETCLGKLNVVDWDKEHSQQEIRDGLLNLLNSEEQLIVETKHQHRDGTDFWVELYVRTFEIGGQPYIYASSRNINDRKLIEEKLKAERQLLAESQKIAHIGSWSWNLKTNQLNWSEENYRIFGISPDAFSLDLDAFQNFIHPDDRSAMSDWITACLEDKNPPELEFRIIRSNNETRILSGRGVLIKDESGQPTDIVGTSQDITERKNSESNNKKLQLQLQQAQKMESIGHLTGGIAHDFNNILSIILGYAELTKSSTKLLAASSSVSGERTQSYLDEILSAGNRARELILQMLVFSRLSSESGDQTVTTILQPLVKEIMKLMRSSIPSTIDINYSLESSELCAAIQPVQLHQILVNLIINARDAIIEYGSINVDVTTQTCNKVCDACHESFCGDYIELKITDTGRGISADVLDLVFDPFFTTKEVGKGTGMGLSVVYGIVHNLGGHLSIQSEHGKGTSIQVLLPAAKKETTDVSEQGRESVQHQKEFDLTGVRMMIVDDEPGVLLMLEEVFSMNGANVTCFSQPKEALIAFENNPDDFDIIITDETMPGLSGLDLAKSILKIRPACPLILCTGYSEHVNPDIARQNGISGFMYKPVKFEELIELVDTLTASVPRINN